MEDIAPELYKKIQADFTTAVRNDGTIKALVNKGNKTPLSNKELTLIDTRLGEHASKALQKTLTVENLPDGRLYYNIAERTVKPIMEQIYTTSNTLAVKAMQLKDRAAGINIAVARGMDPSGRIRELLDFAANSKTAEEIKNALNLPIKTTALDFNDDFLRANAEVRDGMGFKQTITREYDGVGLANGRRPCNWCIGRAGIYESYQEAKDAGAFERHTGCGCTIDVDYTGKVVNDEYTSNVDLPF